MFRNISRDTKDYSLAAYHLIAVFIIVLFLASFFAVLLSRNVKEYLVGTHIEFYSRIFHSLTYNKPAIYSIFDNPEDAAGLEELKALTDELLSYPAVLKIKVLDKQGIVIWSDRKEYIGQRYSSGKDFLRAIRGEISFSEKQSTEQGKSSLTASKHKFFEIYIPVVFGGRNIGVFEIHEADKNLYRIVSEASVIIWFSIFILAASIYLFLSFFFYHSYKSQNKAYWQLAQIERTTIFALAYQAELRDKSTGQHLKRVSLYVRLLAKGLSRDPQYKNYITAGYIEDVVKSAPLHDIGKVMVPDNILWKPGSLTPEEFEIIKKHCESGAMILREAEEQLPFRSFLRVAISLVLSHHEKWNGTGYPEGLKGENIPLAARIMALADVYDALRSERCYKKAYSHEKTCEIIKADSGSHFDPKIVDVFLKYENEFLRVSESISDIKI